MQNQFSLLMDRRFLPLFVTQFLGAFNDNFFKTAFVVSMAYGLIDLGGLPSAMMVSIAAGVFILPFVLVTPIGGDLADGYDKAIVIRTVKAAEIGIVALGIAGLMSGSFVILMLVLFLLGVQSAFFSPSKFSILPQHLKRDELIGGNALLNTGTYLAILAGTISGTILIVQPAGASIVSGALLALACSGYAVSFFIPSARAAGEKASVNFNVFSEAVRIIKRAKAQKKGVFTAILGGSWFFFVGGLYMAQMPNFATEILRVDYVTLTFFMIAFSVGIALGGLLNNRLLNSKVDPKFVPLAALGIALFSLDLFFAASIKDDEFLRGLHMFLSDWEGWRVSIDLFAIAVCGGLYAVPLKAIVQDRTNHKYMARVVAAGAIFDALFVLASAGLAAAVFAMGYAVSDLFLIVSILSVFPVLYVRRLNDK